MIDPGLKEFATPRQAEYVDAIIAHGTGTKAAKAMGIDKAALNRGIVALKKKAALHGYAPAYDMHKIVPAPFVVRGTSTLYDDLGNQKLQWVKTRLDDEQVEQAMREFIDSLVEDVRGLAPVQPVPEVAYRDLLAVYPVGDPHFGLYSWRAESGDDFDLSIAEQITTAAIDRLVASAPAAETGLLLILGDMFHTDYNQNRTLRSGNALDVDTRWAKVMQVGLRALVYSVKRLRSKHRQVMVKILKGNHDEHSSFAIALALDAYFSADRAITVDLSPAEHWYYRFGQVLIGATHGDKAKMPELPGIMACDRSDDWGKASHRYWYQGHIHHDEVREFPGCTVEAFRTLAARDAWHSGEGYRAGRDMRCIVHHAIYGEVERHRCDIACWVMPDDGQGNGDTGDG